MGLARLTQGALTLGLSIWWTRSATRRSKAISLAAWIIGLVGFLLAVIMPLSLMSALTYPNDGSLWWPEGWGLPMFGAAIAAWILGTTTFWILVMTTSEA